MTRMFQTKFGDTAQTHISCWIIIFKSCHLWEGYTYVHWVCSRSPYQKKTVTRECVHTHSQSDVCVSFQHIIMQAANKHPSESWQWKGTWHWTWWSTTQQTQDTWSWPQSCDWTVVVAIANIFNLFQPNFEITGKLP